MIERIYINALLSASAYANWDDDITEIKAELINKRGFSEEQYNAFFDPADGIYEVFAYTSDLRSIGSLCRF
jgi:hypothetical protein